MNGARHRFFDPSVFASDRVDIHPFVADQAPVREIGVNGRPGLRRQAWNTWGVVACHELAAERGVSWDTEITVRVHDLRQ